MATLAQQRDPAHLRCQLFHLQYHNHMITIIVSPVNKEVLYKLMDQITSIDLLRKRFDST